MTRARWRAYAKDIPARFGRRVPRRGHRPCVWIHGVSLGEINATRTLVEEIRRLMFVFEDIVSLDDRAVQLILRQVETKELATALKGVRPEVKQKIGNNMSERAAQNLDEEISLLGPVRIEIRTPVILTDSSAMKG